MCGQCGVVRDGECVTCCDRRAYVFRHGTEIERAEIDLLYHGSEKAAHELRALGSDLYTRPRYILPARIHRWLVL